MAFRSSLWGKITLAVMVCVAILLARYWFDLWSAARFCAAQKQELVVLLPSYQNRFRTASDDDVRQASTIEHAEARGDATDETYFFQERRVEGPWFCNAATLAIEVHVDPSRRRVKDVRLGGRLLQCL